MEEKDDGDAVVGERGVREGMEEKEEKGEVVGEVGEGRNWMKQGRRGDGRRKRRRERIGVEEEEEDAMIGEREVGESSRRMRGDKYQEEELGRERSWKLVREEKEEE